MDVFHPASYTVDHLLSGVQSHADHEIAHMWFTQSRDCAHALRISRDSLVPRPLLGGRGLGTRLISRLCTCITQSRDCAHMLRNPEIACAILSAAGPLCPQCFRSPSALFPQHLRSVTALKLSPRTVSAVFPQPFRSSWIFSASACHRERGFPLY